MKSPLWRFVMDILVNMITYTAIFLLIAVTILMFYKEPPDNYAGFVAVAVAAFVGMIFMVYRAAWLIGEKDFNRVKYGHLRYQQWRGFAAGGIAALPFAVAWALLFSAARPVALLFLLVPVSTGAAYILGYRLYRISDKIFYKGKRRKR